MAPTRVASLLRRARGKLTLNIFIIGTLMQVAAANTVIAPITSWFNT